MRKIRALIFDLDDTLYPEREFVFSGYDAVVRAFASELGWGSGSVGRMRELFESPFRSKVFDTLLSEYQIEPSRHAELIPRMVDVYRHHPPRIHLYPDADAALTHWRQRVRTGLISDGPLAMQQSKAAALGLESRLDAMIFTDAWGRECWKPHPRGFEEIARRLMMPAGECAYVGDNPAKDFVAPNELGWMTLRIVRPGGTYEKSSAPDGGEPHETIASLAELDAILAS